MSIAKNFLLGLFFLVLSVFSGCSNAPLEPTAGANNDVLTEEYIGADAGSIAFNLKVHEPVVLNKAQAPSAVLPLERVSDILRKRIIKLRVYLYEINSSGNGFDGGLHYSFEIPVSNGVATGIFKVIPGTYQVSLNGVDLEERTLFYGHQSGGVTVSANVVSNADVVLKPTEYYDNAKLVLLNAPSLVDGKYEVEIMIPELGPYSNFLYCEALSCSGSLPIKNEYYMATLVVKDSNGQAHEVMFKLVPRDIIDDSEIIVDFKNVGNFFLDIKFALDVDQIYMIWNEPGIIYSWKDSLPEGVHTGDLLELVYNDNQTKMSGVCVVQVQDGGYMCRIEWENIPAYFWDKNYYTLGVLIHVPVPTVTPTVIP